MASGMPSSARQIRATSSAVASSTWKSGRTAAARSASSRTEAYPAIWLPPSLGAGGTASGGTGHSASPVIRSGSRLVTSTRTPGHPASTSSASAAAAATTCSQLSRISRSRRFARAATNRCTGSAVAPIWPAPAWPITGLCRMPSAWRTA